MPHRGASRMPHRGGVAPTGRLAQSLERHVREVGSRDMNPVRDRVRVERVKGRRWMTVRPSKLR